jgi:hypothetical protein
MSTTRHDFRDQSVHASDLALREVAASNPAAANEPTLAGVSLCVRAPGDGQAVRRREKVGVILRLIFGFGGVLAGAVLASMSSEKRGPPPLGLGKGRWLAVGMVCSVGGIALMLDTPGSQRRRTRRHISSRLRLDGLKPPVVEVEDTATYSKMKAVSEDVGLLLMYPESRCVVIEGLTHRYVIYANDVLQVRPVQGATTTGLGIQYLVGGGRRAVLDITLHRQSLWVELKKQTIGSQRDAVMDQVAGLLGPQAPRVVHAAEFRTQ